MSRHVLRMVVLAAVAAVLAPAGSSLAQTAEQGSGVDQGFYVGLAAGYARSGDITVDAKFSDTGAVPDGSGTIPGSGGVDLGMTAGYRYAFLRGEIELGGQLLSTEAITVSNNANNLLTVKDSVSVWSFNGNLLAEAPIDSPVRPYIGGGVGYGSVDIGEKQEGAMTWNGQGGLSWYVSDKVALDAGYRYTQYGDISTNANSSSTVATFKDITVHSGRVGFRVNFGD